MVVSRYNFYCTIDKQTIVYLTGGSYALGAEEIADGRADETTPHVIPLLGRFKNEIGKRMHLMLLLNVTGLGFQVRAWVERLVRALLREGRTDTISGDL